MPKKAQATKDGKTWSMRRRVLGQDFYVSGYRTKTEANRINRWLRAAGLATLKVTPWEQSEMARQRQEELGVAPEDQGLRFCVTLEPYVAERRIPQGLAEHRSSLDKASSKSEAVRTRVARVPMAEVQTHHLQDFISALREEGKLSGTLQLERAVLRGLFNHARKRWHWGCRNPTRPSAWTCPAWITCARA